MISLSNLPVTKTIKRKKRVGRGYGSGKGGHASGRGTKGQKSRSKIGVVFEGTKSKKSLIKRLPLWRGKGRLKSLPTASIPLSWLENKYKEGERVDLDSLLAKKIIKRRFGINLKVLANGKLTKPLEVCLPVSAAAAKAIKKAGGRVVLPKRNNDAGN